MKRITMCILLAIGGCGSDGKKGEKYDVEVVAQDFREAEETLPDVPGADVCAGGCAGLLTAPTLVKAEFTVVVEVNSTTGIPGQKFQFETRKARGTPAGELTFQWNLDGGVSADAQESVAGREASFPGKGQYLVSVLAVDGQGNKATAGVLITIHSQSQHYVGDVNGDGEVAQTDANLIASHLAGELQLAPAQFGRADVDLDGVLTQSDADLIQSAVDEEEPAPRLLQPASGSLGTSILLVHPVLLAPDEDVTVRFDGSDPIVPLRSMPGYAVLPVPPDQDAAGTTKLRVLVEGQEMDQFDFEVLASTTPSAEPGQKVTEAIDLLGASLDTLPLLLDAYLTPLKTSATQRAVFHGLTTIAADSFAVNGAAFRDAFLEMDAEGRAAFEKVALANGLDDALATLGELKERTATLAGWGPGPAFLLPEESAAVLEALCAARELLDAANHINEINAIASGYLCWFDWWPLNATPAVTEVVAYLSDMSGALVMVSGVLSLIRPYLPEIGELRLASSVAGLQPGQTAELSAHLALDVPHSLCSDLAAYDIPDLMTQLEEQLALQLAASIPLAGQAFEAGQFNVENADEVSALLYDVISELAGGVFDALGVQQLLVDLATLVCSLTDDGVPLGSAGITATCSTVADSGKYECTVECEGAVLFSASADPCGEDREAQVEVLCGGCGPANCTGCCADDACVEVGVQHPGQCGLEGLQCEVCPQYFDCQSGACSCSSDCITPGDSKCVGSDVWTCSEVAVEPPCNKLEFSEPCLDDAECVDGECVDGCSPDNCSGCCMEDDTCMPGDAPIACGGGGLLCQDCGLLGCVAGQCKCVPDCDGKQCGPDGCGDICGECDAAACQDMQTYVPAQTCSAGLCITDGIQSCSDSNPCTIDSCDPDAGCLNSPAMDNSVCDDGNFCTADDKCVAGVCVGPIPLSCDDFNPCTDDSCDPATGCTQENNEAPCEDGMFCTVGEQCEGGLCAGSVPMTCDDFNPCTDDSCDESGDQCLFVPNSADCDDGNICTTDDACSNGECEPGGQVDCSDGDNCTVDSCDPAGGCEHAMVDCDDGDPCTADSCNSMTAECVHTVKDCDDSNPCTTDSCGGGGACEHVNNTSACNDGNVCTTGDQCQGGVCVGPVPLTCNDGNPCTDDSCAPGSGCSFVNNSADCNDNDACTLDDVCSGGSCVGGNPVDCSDDNICTDDTCSPDPGCVHVNNSVGCNDEDICTTGDICGDGACSGTPLNCDDASPCTEDYCNPANGMCEHDSLHCKENLLSCGNHMDACMMQADCGDCGAGEFCVPEGFCIGTGDCTATDHGLVTTDDAKTGAYNAGYVYVGDFSGGIKVVDVMNPAAPKVIKNVDAGSFVYGMEYYNNYLYGCDIMGGLQVFDLIDPTDPQPRGNVPLDTARLVTVSGNYAYVALGSNGLEIIDISDPDAPLAKKNIGADNSVWDAAVYNGFLYLSDQAAFYVYDVIDPVNPSSLNQILPPDGDELREVEFNYPFAYVAASDGSLHVLDATTPGDESFIGELSLAGTPMGVEIAHGHAYVSVGTGGVHIVDIASNPTAPALVDTYVTPGTAHHAFFQSGYLMVSEGANGLRIATVPECYM